MSFYIKNLNRATIINGFSRNRTTYRKWLVCFFVLVYPAFSSDSYSQYLSPTDPGPGDHFGQVVAISGDHAIIGSPYEDNAKGTNAGSVYFYRKNGSSWEQYAKKTANDGTAQSAFGTTVAISGDWAVVGSPADQNAGNLHGSAYVFHRTNSGWSQVKKLTANVGATGDGFGTAVAISGQTIVIGAPYDDNVRGGDAGAVYVFAKTSNGWVQQKKLVPNNLDEQSHLGVSVGISGNNIVAGAPYDNALKGSIYIFNKGNTGWKQVARKVVPEGQIYTVFGSAIDISGDFIAAGSPYEKHHDLTAAGAVYIYRRTTNGWSLEQRVEGTNPGLGNRFGLSLSLNNGYLAVGAPSAPGGRIHVFQRFVLSMNPVWAESYVKNSLFEEGEGFGFTVDISSSYLLAGAATYGATDQGRAFIAPLTNSAWAAASSETIGSPATTAEHLDRNTRELPDRITLHGNYPNPFNPATTIRFDLPQAADVTLEVVNLMGQLVLRSEHRGLSAGANQQIPLDGSQLASGTYLYRLTAVIQGKASMATGRMVLLK